MTVEDWKKSVFERLLEKANYDLVEIKQSRDMLISMINRFRSEDLNNIKLMLSFWDLNSQAAFDDIKKYIRHVILFMQYINIPFFKDTRDYFEHNIDVNEYMKIYDELDSRSSAPISLSCKSEAKRLILEFATFFNEYFCTEAKIKRFKGFINKDVDRIKSAITLINNALDDRFDIRSYEELMDYLDVTHIEGSDNETYLYFASTLSRIANMRYYDEYCDVVNSNSMSV